MAKYFFFERPQRKKCRLYFRNINVTLKKGEIKNKNNKKKLHKIEDIDRTKPVSRVNIA